LRVRSTHGGMRRIVVADNGHGISSQTRKRLFQPFVTSKGAAGNGLGLWVSQGIVKKHNGVIRVRTCDDPAHSGTVFAVVLPANSSQSLQSPSLRTEGGFGFQQRLAS
jgi:signal transduction histidine kinase